MSWLVSAKQYIPAVIGEPFGGGYFAGYISHTANGVPTHALIVAPRATGASGSGYALTTNYAWKTSDTATTNTASTFDGRANTDAIITAGIASHPAAGFCVNLSIGGFTDWYLPAMLELEIAYFNLKPATGNAANHGKNAYSVPRRDNSYTSSYPSQTQLAAWQSPSGSEFFLTGAEHLSSTTPSATSQNNFGFSSGGQFANSKTQTAFRTRAFRRIAL
jgi:hypothetical protein